MNPYATLSNAYARTAYYFIALLVALWIAQLSVYLRSISFSAREFLRRNRTGILFCLAVAGLCFLSVPPRFRTLSDETNLLGISHAMSLDKTVYNLTMGKFYFGTFNPILREVDKRRLLFPFLTHLLHLCRGYDYRNAFLLNFLVLWVFLSGIFIAARRLFDFPTAAGAVLLVVAQPVVTLFASSAGYDFFASAFLAATWAAAYLFMKAPSAEALAFLWMQLLMLTQTRYESFGYFFLILGLLWLLGYVRREQFGRYRHVYLTTPMLLIPVALQILMSHYKKISENPAGTAAFAARHLGANLRSILDTLADMRFYYPYANVLFWISGATLLFVAYNFFPSRNSIRPPHQRHFLVVAVATLAAQYLIYLSYYAGDLALPASARFYIGAAIAASLIPLALRFYWPETVTPGRFLLGAAVLLALYHPVAMRNQFINTLTVVRETQEDMVYLDSLGDRRVLIVADRPGQFCSLGYGAVDFNYARGHAQELLNELSRHLYLGIVVFQRINYDTKASEPDTALGPEFPLDTLQEIQITATDFLRISQVSAGT